MRFRTVLSLTTFFLFCFTLAVWRSPLSARTKDAADRADEVQSISGKIASIGDAEFTLELGKNQKGDTVKFLMDSETRVDGKLAVGANATVDYRSADGKNIATHIRVMPASGLRSH